MNYQNRNEIPEQYKWNLCDIYTSVEEWEKDFNLLSSELGKLDCFKGKLNNPENILEMYNVTDEQGKIVEKLYCYAYLGYCEDSKDAEKQTRYGKISSLLAQLSEALSYIEPEMSKLTEQQIDEMIARPDFSDHTERLKSLKKGKVHILSEQEEKLLAMSSDYSRYFQEIFNRLDSGDLDFGTVTVDGEEVKLGHGTYSVLLQHKDQNVRKAAFERYYKAYIDHINTIAGIYEGSVKHDVFSARARKFGSAMEKALFYEDVDKCVYENLIQSVNNSFAPLHDYIALRKRILGVDQLNMYDLYTPLFEGTDIAVDFDKAFDIVLEGLKPLGEDYRKLLIRAKQERWVDVMETPTKRSGAFSMGVYGVHPYVMLNYQPSTHEVFTIAHELGHSLHSFFSSATQPYAKNDYTIFVAEVASTCNEVLLLKHLLSQEQDVNTKKYLLSYYLDMLRTTMYRQAMFAEFEYITHQKAEQGEPLSYQLMNEEYLALNKKYYGPSVNHNDQIAYEWARIPHFYRAFYVYKYSTGITSAVCIANKILTEGQSAVDKYKQFLSLGCSTDPVSELKVAGVDLTTSEPFDIVTKSFEDTLEQLKELCK